MITLKGLQNELKKRGIAITEIDLSESPDLEDHDIQLGDGYYLQLHPYGFYICLHRMIVNKKGEHISTEYYMGKSLKKCIDIFETKPTK